MKGLKIILFCLVMVVVFIAVWQNIPRLLDQSIKFQFKIDYLDFSRESRPIPVIFVVPLAFVGGLFLMYLVNLGSMFRLRRRVKVLEKELRVAPGLQTEDTTGTSAP